MSPFDVAIKFNQQIPQIDFKKTSSSVAIVF